METFKSPTKGSIVEYDVFEKGNTGDKFDPEAQFISTNGSITDVFEKGNTGDKFDPEAQFISQEFKRPPY